MTPSQSHVSPQTAYQQQSRLTSLVVLLALVGPLTLVLAACLNIVLQIEAYPKRRGWLAVAMPLGGAILWLRWPEVHSVGEQLLHMSSPLLTLVRPHTGQPLQPAALLDIGIHMWPLLLQLWLEALSLSPLVALYLLSSRVKSAEELERDRDERKKTQQQAEVTRAQQRSSKAPDAVARQFVLGVPIRGDLHWSQNGWFTYPAAFLGRHIVLIGGSGTGKTETSLRIAYGAAKVYGWKVYYLDCKGDNEIAERFRVAMQSAGRTSCAVYPSHVYDGWRGDATAILNRLIAVLDFTEPYYRDMARMMISLAVEAPSGPPRSSTQFLERLNIHNLQQLYAGRPEEQELLGIRAQDAAGVYNRFRSFFRALQGGLDGDWAFEDVDAAYILLDGLALKDQTASIGRYLLEDFSHFVSKRKQSGQQVLFIVDEFSAIAVGGTDAANLFERVRSYGASVVVTSQSYAGMGEGADRILGAAAGLIIHQCPDPEALLLRAGEHQRYERRVGFTEGGLSTNPRPYATGQGMLGASRRMKVDPDTVKQLAPGSCIVVAGGTAQHVQVSRLQRSRGLQPVQQSSQRMQEHALVIEVARLRTYVQAETPHEEPQMIGSEGGTKVNRVSSLPLQTNDDIAEYE